ncbi:hypothetical protein GGS23DRAFT_186000 [Durotheca rogersii]|uniref:uncharacterized protein n=1 Tax=Durotheca rogersii TaxID=419775 RepID=UPI00221EED39|nr:uncharacterized protein GGS23DRAFT_186000 [Durotheca rogersii]KAI5867613.1 hypothetical protein GGS23DRAFT_186000 [Durotheca rogersii]
MASLQPEPTYTVFVRLPFPRDGFVDPPPANWDSAKDEALWSIISRLSKTEIDWNDIADRFEVTVDFLLQQVAWLTERHASQVRAQMRRATTIAKGSAAPSPQPGPDGPFSAEPIRRTASGDRLARVPSVLSIRKETPAPRNDGSVPGTPSRSTPRPVVTRTSSSNTAVYTTRGLGLTNKAPIKSTTDAQRHPLASLPIAAATHDSDPDAASPRDTEPLSASESSSSSPAQSRIIRRPPRFQGHDAESSFADDEDTAPAFPPYKPDADGSGSGGPHDLSATVRVNPPRDYAKRQLKGSSARERERAHQSQTSDSSSSSMTPAIKSISSDNSRPGGPLSPRRATELTSRSPASKGKAHSRDSDGSHSLCSSFSDLDDASVTQSALEEALASKMQEGTVGSLRGTLSAAFRSRYLPGSKH